MTDILKYLTVFCSVMLWTGCAYAIDFEFLPRLETGAMIYSMAIAPENHTELTQLGVTSGRNETRKEREFTDTIGFVGAGTTLFLNRMFVDVSGQYAFHGSDRSSSSWSSYAESSTVADGKSQFISAYPYDNGKFNRTDYAVSVGYGITRRFSIFAGYKWTTVDLKTSYQGPLAMLNIDQYVVNGTLSGQDLTDFNYEGWFVGLTHGWPVDGTFQGLLSVNLALANLNSERKEDSAYTIRFDSINGQDLAEPTISEHKSADNVKGDTLGMTLAINWYGDTMIKDLSYSLGISGYRYSFAAKRSNRPDIHESVLSFKLGISYAF